MKASSNLTHSMKCFYRLRSPLFLNSSKRVLHVAAVNYKNLKPNPKPDVYFARIESTFFHRTLEDDPKYSKSILKHTYFSDLLANIPDLNVSLDDDLSNLSADSLLPYTATLTRKLLDQTLDVTSPELIHFAASIKKNVKILPKEDISKILSLIYLWPFNNKLFNKSMNTIIFALDYACMISVNIKTASVEEVLLWMEPWHWLGLCTMSEFVQMATGKLFWSADRKEHVVQLLFYMGELRRLPNHYDRPSIEKKVIRYIGKFNCNEIGILAAGFYKSSTQVTNYVLYKQLVKRVVNDAAKFHPIALNSALKLLRATVPGPKEEGDILAIYKSLKPLVPSLSGMCLVQIAMLGTPKELVDRDLMRTILNLLCEQRYELREKDFQRVMYSCAYGMDEEDMKMFVDCVVDEIYRRNLPTIHHAENARLNPEIYIKVISYIETVLFLQIMGHRSSHLIASAIDMGIQLSVNPSATSALYQLDILVDFFYPDYSGPRLDESVVREHHTYIFPKKNHLRPAMGWFSFEWRETNAEMLRRFYLDVCDACGGSENVACHSLLPLYEHRDLVVCTDKDGNFVPVPPEFGTQPSWKVQPAINTEDRTFCALMLLRDRSRKGLPDYTLYQKMRETLMRSLGYRIAVVKYKVFDDIPKEEKCAYIRETIKMAT